MDLMVQCKFQKDNMIQVAWVDKKKGLKVGVIVELKSMKGNEQGWEVKEMYNEKGAVYVKDAERDYTRTRAASDI